MSVGLGTHSGSTRGGDNIFLQSAEVVTMQASALPLLDLVPSSGRFGPPSRFRPLMVMLGVAVLCWRGTHARACATTPNEVNLPAAKLVSDRFLFSFLTHLTVEVSVLFIYSALSSLMEDPVARRRRADDARRGGRADAQGEMREGAGLCGDQ